MRKHANRELVYLEAQPTEVPNSHPMPRITSYIFGDLKRRCKRCKVTQKSRGKRAYLNYP